MKMTLFSSGTLPTQRNKTTEVPVSLTLNGSLGRATITFKGSAQDVMHPTNFAGNFTLKGPSMASIGDLVGVTLPTTAEFSSKGYVDKQQKVWRINLKQLDLGASHLYGQFIYDKGRKIPLLSGQLNGNKFLITDLGPAFGSLDANKPKQKVLPRRPFDLKSLRTMHADVKINIKYVDLNTKVLQPLSPLRGHLTLNGGVLKIQNLDARTAKGQLKGDLKLDGRGKIALWNADLRWSGVRLENWVRQVREKGEAPYISGNLHGKAALNGQGISSADMLATMKGSVQSELQNGALSHLVVEAAGLDLAQSLGVMFKGDDALPLHCAVADLVADKGVLRPKVMVLDTEDSALWLTGAISLAQETIDLKLIVMPKDFSPLSLRSPLHVSGTFANPKTSLEKRKIGLKLAGSALLSLLNPLAAIIPLLDNGDIKEAKRHAADCSALMQRGLAKTKAK
ncbi:MAG TPA: AsmA family protein, partial [Methylophilus sp.]